jgi:hypothetical protein
MFGIPIPAFGLSLILSIALCVHVVRTNQQMYWLFIILAFQPIGGIVYFVAILLPGLSGGPTARRMAKAAGSALDPGRTHREAKAAYDDTPSVQNAMKLAEAGMKLGRWEEAEGLYAKAAQGLYADDPALLLGRAKALLELGRPADALASLDRLGGTPESREPSATLATARALHGLGRNAEAEKAFRSAVTRVPGLEAVARWAVFLAETGRTQEAREVVADLDQRLAKTRAHFRIEAKVWRDYAASKVSA